LNNRPEGYIFHAISTFHTGIGAVPSVSAGFCTREIEDENHDGRLVNNRREDYLFHFLSTILYGNLSHSFRFGRVSYQRDRRRKLRWTAGRRLKQWSSFPPPFNRFNLASCFTNFARELERFLQFRPGFVPERSKTKITMDGR